MGYILLVKKCKHVIFEIVNKILTKFCPRLSGMINSELYLNFQIVNFSWSALFLSFFTSFIYHYNINFNYMPIEA